ncbi:MAG: topoisomerase C-terminal repeat-containing protein [Planctomycetes bacterium]|nr:topoisomerase C-terminal repeat-containing protein [Planctomycetota bacterium]
MGKTLIITEKKSVADDFARVFGHESDSQNAKGRRFKKHDLHYESDDLIIAWASGHLLELQEPGLYQKEWKYWSLEKLPIIPDSFVHIPREADAKGKKLLSNLDKLIRDDEVTEIVNGCDAGREGELIFNLILDHARGKRKKVADKKVVRLWLQSMTTDAILEAFRHLKADDEMTPLREAAYCRDQADWLVGMNGTRALTKRFLGGKNRVSLAVGRVKTPTLAFLVDREREIDNFIPVPYWELYATFDVDSKGSGEEENQYVAQWNGKDAEGKATDRILDGAEAAALRKKVEGKIGEIEDTTRRSKEKPPQLFDLTQLQRRASSAFGFTLKRTLAIAQTLYEQKKAITYPRTSSRYLPQDYRGEVPRIMQQLAGGGYRELYSKVPNRERPDSEQKGQVFDDKKVSDHFALIPTGEVPKSLRPDEQKIYDLIVRRFFAAFMPSAERETTTRKTTVEGEVFKATARKLVVTGWRAAEPIAADDIPFPDAAADGKALCLESELSEKATTPPSRFTDGTLVAEMETCGKHVENEEEAEALKEIGIGTPATRAAIVEDLIFKHLARREGRNLVPTALGSTLVRIVRNLQLDALAKPDMTGTWEKRLNMVMDGHYDASVFMAEIRGFVEEMVAKVKNAAEGSAILAADHPGPLHCPKCGKGLEEKAYSYFCVDQEDCGIRIHKDAGGKHLFPEVLGRLIEHMKDEDPMVGPFTGFERPKAPCKMKISEEGQVLLKPEGDVEFEQHELRPEAQIDDGTPVGKCPKCGAEVQAQGTGYACTSEDCKFRLSKKLLMRELPPAQVKKMLAEAGAKTDLIEGFISKRGRPFSAMLFFEEGSLKWEFPPRAPRKKAAKKTTKKKAGKKTGAKKAGAKKKATKKTADED